MSTLAFVVAMSMGAAYAAPLITGSQIAKETVTGANIKNESVTSNDLAMDSIGSTRVKDGNLLFKDFRAGQVAKGGLATRGFTFVDKVLTGAYNWVTGTDDAETFVDNGSAGLVLNTPGFWVGMVGFRAETSGSGTWSCQVYSSTPSMQIGELKTFSTANGEALIPYTIQVSDTTLPDRHFRLSCTGSGRTVTESEIIAVGSMVAFPPAG
jgi:hypothetical protein